MSTYMLIMRTADEAAAQQAMADAGLDFDAMIETMSRFNEELMDAGVLVAMDGLDDPATGVVVDYSSTPPVVTDGPYGEAKELFNGYWILDVPSREDAIAWAAKAPLGPGVKLEVRRVPTIDEFPQDNEWIQREIVWRRQLAPKVAHADHRDYYMLIGRVVSDEAAAAFLQVPFDQSLAAMGAFNESLVDAGAIVAGEGLDDPAQTVVLDFSSTPPVVTDGPYGETKELFFGFWVLDVPSQDEAVEWAKRIPMTVPGMKAEIRRVPSLAEFPQDNEWIRREAAWRRETADRAAFAAKEA